jgi:tetratricopeptide (TPR) repeat protein
MAGSEFISMSSPDFHRRAGRLFLEVCDAAPGERAALLARAAGDDSELRRHVQALLDRDGEPSGFLDAPVLGEDFRIPTLGGAAPAAAPLPGSIGRYRILSLLGRGGMGTVYLAEQDNPKRHVALKVIDADLASPDALRRFAFEAEVLARVHHPAIAQIHEAGTDSADGHTRVYFAMELVKGQPLTAHTVGAALELRERLELIAIVCDAVQHAHSKGVVHRDIKPANILVDDAGRPRVLDFGIARTIIAEPGDQTMHTLAGQVVGTLPYMAPEQVAGDTRDVDTRVDVYALGVVMYELLVGRQPLDVAGRPLMEAARIICEVNPPRLGTLDRRLRGDVETIVAQALAKDPPRRYQTAADLAADIRRFLAGEPIASRPASAAYQLRKFARRNRGLVALSTALAVFVVASAVGFGVVLTRQSPEERRLQDRAAAAEQFLTGVLAGADVWEIGDREALVSVLDRFAEALPTPGLDPVAEARIRTRLGQAYQQMRGSYSVVEQAEAAEAQLRLALGLFRVHLGIEAPETLAAMDELACALADLAVSMGGITEADVRLRIDRRNEAIALLENALRTAHVRLGRTDRRTLGLMQNLCSVLIEANELERAEPVARDLLKGCHQVWGPEHRSTLEAEMGLANILVKVGQKDEGIERLWKIVESRRRVLGADSESTHASLVLLGRSLQADHPEQALAPLAEALAIRTQRFGADDKVRLSEAHQYATLLRTAGHLEEALEAFRDIIERRVRVLPPNHGHTLRSRAMLVRTLIDLQRLPAAEVEARSLVDDANAGLEEGHPDIGSFRALHAEILGKRGLPDQAEEQFRIAFEEVRGATGEFALLPKRVFDEAVAFLRAAGRWQEADEFEAALSRP